MLDINGDRECTSYVYTSRFHGEEKENVSSALPRDVTTLYWDSRRAQRVARLGAVRRHESPHIIWSRPLYHD